MVLCIYVYIYSIGLAHCWADVATISYEHKVLPIFYVFSRCCWWQKNSLIQLATKLNMKVSKRRLETCIIGKSNEQERQQNYRKHLKTIRLTKWQASQDACRFDVCYPHPCVFFVSIYFLCPGLVSSSHFQPCCQVDLAFAPRPWSFPARNRYPKSWFISWKMYDWLVVWLPFFIFPYIGNFIIPIDFHIFQRGGWTTNQMKMSSITGWFGSFSG